MASWETHFYSSLLLKYRLEQVWKCTETCAVFPPFFFFSSTPLRGLTRVCLCGPVIFDLVVFTLKILIICGGCNQQNSLIPLR